MRLLPLRRRGKYLFKPDGTRFYIYGMAYQESVETVQDAATGGFPEPETYTDPLSLPQACARDAVNLRNTGINAIRVYSVDSTKDHSACVRSFEDAVSRRAGRAELCAWGIASGR